MKITLEPQDYDDVRDAMMGVIDFEPTNELIDFTLRARSELVAKAVAWH